MCVCVYACAHTWANIWNCKKLDTCNRKAFINGLKVCFCSNACVVMQLDNAHIQLVYRILTPIKSRSQADLFTVFSINIIMLQFRAAKCNVHKDSWTQTTEEWIIVHDVYSPHFFFFCHGSVWTQVLSHLASSFHIVLLNQCVFYPCLYNLAASNLFTPFWHWEH